MSPLVTIFAIAALVGDMTGARGDKNTTASSTSVPVTTSVTTNSTVTTSVIPSTTAAATSSNNGSVNATSTPTGKPTSEATTAAISTSKATTVITTAKSTTPRATTSTGTTAPKSTTEYIFDKYSVSCESAYSYDYKLFNTTCKIKLENATGNANLMAITCYQRPNCQGNFTEFGSLNAKEVKTSGGYQMDFNNTGQALSVVGPVPRTTVEYNCSFISLWRTVHTSWNFFTYPIYAVYGTHLNATTMQIRVLLKNHTHCLLNGSLYDHNSTVHLHHGGKTILPCSISNVTENGELLRQFLFHLNGSHSSVRLSVHISNKNFTTTYLFVHGDPLFEDRLLAYGVLAFLVFMVVVLIYVTYMLARRRDWSYKKLEEVEEKKYPVPYFKQW
ncbi:membrane glycoprotein UL119 [Panine betaherpesvirus 2]|uniref:Membrane glycoprotein UL119 n=1 Tax=Panine betaherpesvirus 2 TaxID=188763 RepID=Q8QRZ0_9BETA|nr:membrane glycoprotein UL119 [Panine betaherpesvirus 2]AAM00748.1 membrane glycoprotein UL119 [Panine betaherpesvirus 2]QXV67862.1 membrane glycoprotein UL119 [Panine betaherpesvirus 2]